MAAWLNIFRAKKSLPPKGALSDILPETPPQVRVVFMGTPGLSAVLLEALVEAGYLIVGVVTKADQSVGRTQEPLHSAVKKVALAKNIPVLQPERFDAETIAALEKWKPELIVVAAYGKILPQAVLKIPRYGCINFHTSLLPAWRGASPIQNALLAGATETGVTIMLMDTGMDTGDILSQRALPIERDDTQASLSEKLTRSGRALLLETLPLWVAGNITPLKQENSQATLCQLIEREDGHIMWEDEAESLYNRYRALTPWPGIFSFWKKDNDHLRLKFIRVSYQKQNPQITHALGEVFEVGEKVGVQTGLGIFFLEEVQLEGKNAMPVQDFVRGNPTFIGSLLQ